VEAQAASVALSIPVKATWGRFTTTSATTAGRPCSVATVALIAGGAVGRVLVGRTVVVVAATVVAVVATGATLGVGVAGVCGSTTTTTIGSVVADAVVTGAVVTGAVVTGAVVAVVAGEVVAGAVVAGAVVAGEVVGGMVVDVVEVVVVVDDVSQTVRRMDVRTVASLFAGVVSSAEVARTVFTNSVTPGGSSVHEGTRYTAVITLCDVVQTTG
jgi:hypothetical protein